MDEADHNLVRRLTILLFVIAGLTFAFSRLDLLYGHKFFDVTGRAEWIWAQHQLSLNLPLAFFATRNFDLPPNRQFTHIKVFGDPEYTLYFNGAQIGARRVGEESAIDVYDVSAFARDRGNRIVIAARSANGVGGVIASVDISPEYQNIVPTGRDWAIVREWRNDLLLTNPPPQRMQSPMRIGRPPIGRWNYLSRRPGTPVRPVQRIVSPKSSYRFKTAIPTVEDRSGVLVVVPRPITATVYDFGPISGRARLTIDYDNGASRAVRVRFANAPSELRAVEGPVDPFVFAAGERTIIDPLERQFRFVMVYESAASVEVAQ
ncbi:MAG TPA: hypothetical protein VKU62_05110 [Thermoanaerobaculia bacterium]|nr:hypothetical protein [Thermoanaerobaculia bacterium]